MATAENSYAEQGNAEQDLPTGPTYVPDLNDKAMERRIVRKIDMRILPFICISYLINFLDRVSKTCSQSKRSINESTGQLG